MFRMELNCFLDFRMIIYKNLIKNPAICRIFKYSAIECFNGRMITKIIKPFYKRVIQVNIEKVYFEQFFFEPCFFYLLFYQGLLG